MFKEYDTTLIKHHLKRKCYTYEVSIIDDSFSETVLIKKIGSKGPYGKSIANERHTLAAMLAVIKIYSDKKLNVSHNLYFLCREIGDQIPWYRVKDLMKELLWHDKKYKKFCKEVKNYHKRYKKLKSFW